MRKLMPITLAVVALLVNSSTSRADEKSHRKAAEDLLKIMDTEKQLQAAIDQSLDVQIKANPIIAPYKDVMKKFLAKYMSYQSLKDDLIKIYVDTFTEPELNQIVAFYKTPTGKKLVERQSELTNRCMTLGVSRVQANQAELEQMIRDAMTGKKE